VQFTTNCTQCPRLADYLAAGRSQYPSYQCKPVPSFGAASPRLLIVGLAPGWHGANATGRPFTGDYCGILLYQTLHRYGFANQDHSAQDDGLQLINARLTNAVRCVPPENKPTPAEVTTCNSYLQQELAALAPNTAVLALGVIAHQAVIKALGLKQSAHKFKHGASTRLNQLQLFNSYHVSRYNTNTGRLTEAMFHTVFDTITTWLNR
jgi:uracil-DNA glycosylase